MQQRVIGAPVPYRSILVVCFLCAGIAQAQTPSEPSPDTLFQRLLTAIRQIPIIDNHAHPALIGDAEMDALTFAATGLSAMEPFLLPVRLRPTNLEYVPALQALYGYPHTDLSSDHLQELKALKRKQRSTVELSYFNSVLDKVGISVSLANRVGMTRAPLDRRRFKWVPFVDAYLFPLNNTSYKKQSADYSAFFSSEEKLLKRYFEQVETTRPRGFEAYLRFLHESLGRLKTDGAVAVKFEAAYLRSLRVNDLSGRQARRIYERYRNTTEVPLEEYRDLQDYLFRYLLQEVAKLGLPIHIHTGLGIGNTFRLGEAHPLQLENILSDARYRQTTFVLLHGGYPFTRETILLAAKPNVYVDASALSLVLYSQDVAKILKEWLTFAPEKILFGTDAVVIDEVIGAEETYWLATETARQALALALSEMVQEGRCDEAEARRMARLLLHDNAAQLYGLP
jgi:predicted TIM-barrel fold metal-dependent hydrolase